MIFPCIEIGSLPKLPGRQAKVQNREPSVQDKEILEYLCLRYPVLSSSLLTYYDARQIQEITKANSSFYIALQEAIGLDYVFDGEAHRKEMYQSVVEHVRGMQKLDQQVSFVNKEGYPNIFTPFSFVHPLVLEKPLHTEETCYILSQATKAVKVPITGAYTLGTWSDLGSFPAEMMKQGRRHSEARRVVMEQLVLEFADKVINPSLKALASLGVARIQIDEPNASAFYGQEELLYEATRRSVAGVESVGGSSSNRIELGMHICFSRDYSAIAGIGKIPEMKFLTLEIANRDAGDHQVYRDVLEAFEREGYKGKYCIGVQDVHTDVLEPAELITERLLYAADIVDVNRIEAAPDCGLRSRKLPLAVKKLERLMEGVRIARKKRS